MHIQGIHGSHPGPAAVTSAPSLAVGRASGGPGALAGATAINAADAPAGVATAPVSGRTTPLRVDAQRNLEHVLRAAREVFGELGYGAPMEDVARRARVGVGTVYRRFPSKDVLVRRIAEEETARLTEQARTALEQETEPWAALSCFLRASVASGAGRLLPPRVLRAEAGTETAAPGGAAGASDAPRVPQPRQFPYDGQQAGPGLRLVGQPPAASGPGAAAEKAAPPQDDAGASELLGVVGKLVERARAAGELRTDVTVGDVLLVIATAAPSLPDAAQQAAASERLLDILLEGLRSRPNG